MSDLKPLERIEFYLDAIAEKLGGNEVEVPEPQTREEYFLKKIVDNASGGGITPTGKIDITSMSEVDVTDYATAQVVDRNLTAENIKKDVEILGVTGTFESSGSTWTTVAEEQTGTTVYNSGVNLYFLQLSDVTDFGSPVIKVTHDNNVYYCFWDIINKCWRDTTGAIVEEDEEYPCSTINAWCSTGVTKEIQVIMYKGRAEIKVEEENSSTATITYTGDCEPSYGAHMYWVTGDCAFTMA